PTTPFDVNTNFNNIIESMNSVQVLTLVSYRLIQHDLEAEQTFRDFDSKKGEGPLEDEEILKSKAMFQDRLEKIKTLNLFDPNDQLLYRILKGYGYDHETLAKSINIHRLAASDYIAIDGASEDPFLSALMVNALCQEFIRYNKTLKTDRSSESLDFLENIVVDKKKILDEKTKALNDYKLDNNVFNHDSENKSKYALITDYELKREREASELNGYKLSLNSVDNSIQQKKSTLGKLNQDEIQVVNQRIVDLKRQISDLQNADPVANKARIARLREDLQIENSRVEAVNDNKTSQEDLKQLEKQHEDLKLKVEIAQADLANIDLSLKRLRSEVSNNSSKQFNTSDFEREVNLASTEYISAQDKYNTAKNKSMIIGSSIRQILEGQPSYEPEQTDEPLWLGMIGAGSFFGTLIIIFLVNVIDPNIRISSRLEKSTGLKNIGSVNILKSKDFNMREIFNDRTANKEYEVFSHFLRKLRYEIQSSEGKVFLITSTQIKSGKTFLIISLSYALSLVSKKVLIIDTNFRHNSLTKALLPRGRGENKKLLRKALLFEEEEDELLLEEGKDGSVVQDEDDAVARMQKSRARASIISKTRFIGVDIIGNVGGRDSPSEIMAGRDFKEMINNLSQQYDYVLMEGPALNDYSDSKELIEFSDRVIPVFRADAALSNMDKESLKYLKSINGRLMGTVLNNVNMKNLAI
ncbi:MAG TPA: AAA family ATPase, partial [Chryseolinea sp.]|nr:AAA family ATPase [Chryseolinea sp.]